MELELVMIQELLRICRKKRGICSKIFKFVSLQWKTKEKTCSYANCRLCLFSIKWKKQNFCFFKMYSFIWLNRWSAFFLRYYYPISSVQTNLKTIFFLFQSSSINKFNLFLNCIRSTWKGGTCSFQVLNKVYWIGKHTENV